MIRSSNLIINTLCYDPYCLGRAYDIEGYDDDTLMEILTHQIDDHRQFRGKNRNPKPLSEWPGVIVDGDGKVRIIDWEFGQITKISGTVNLSWCPPEVADLRITYHGLHGVIATDQLPNALTNLYLFGNALEGSFSTKGLPQNITQVDIHSNLFAGSLDLADLPQRLEFFDASENRFCGTVSFAQLPSSLLQLVLSDNAIIGPVEFTSLPEQLEKISLCDNNIEQDVVFVPQRVTIELDGNQIRKKCDL
mmetsp:Transcript_26479/g.41220  ORF Transcript_26479/g.41220 Transcript_26479/m.41220 type:complete len:249 (-) Transcript_26479:93-839(-)